MVNERPVVQELQSALFISLEASTSIYGVLEPRECQNDTGYSFPEWMWSNGWGKARHPLHYSERDCLLPSGCPGTI
jgi:hypothetical protein